jgi:hypothetical protein
MEIEPLLDNVVVFDIGAPYHAALLCELLQADRLSWLYERRGVQVVAAALRADADDLANLLRTVERWAGSRRLGPVRFELDDRNYVLQTSQTLTV